VILRKPQRKLTHRRVAGALLAGVLLAAACGGGDDDDAGGNSDAVTVRWFVGLGTGSEPEQQDRQQAIVDEFNESHEDVQLEIEIVDNAVAAETLATQIAGGNAPDIIGPIGIRGSNSFAGQFLDLEPLVDETGYDLSVYEQEQVEFWREEDGTLTALPFGVFPSFIWYNTALFDEAGLEYPPQEFGQPYADGDPWDYDKVRELAKVLTVDANGNDATNPAFDPNNIVQWGFHNQFNDDARAQGTMFGPGSFVGDGGSAEVPEHWLAAWQWYHDMIWVDHSAPNQAHLDSDTLSQGNAFNTGNVAMAFTHLWYTCCVVDDDGVGREDFDIAVAPSYNGTTTSKLHADTFRILETTENPDAAFEVLTYLLDDAAPDLLDVYGGMPARTEAREPFFEALDETFPQGVNWQVAIDSLAYPDVPSHEGNMPNFDEAEARIDEFETLIDSDPNANMATQAAQLQADLTTIFAAGS
jgi:multiple sugar transport system substrate-binding protein